MMDNVKDNISIIPFTLALLTSAIVAFIALFMNTSSTVIVFIGVFTLTVAISMIITGMVIRKVDLRSKGVLIKVLNGIITTMSLSSMIVLALINQSILALIILTLLGIFAIKITVNLNNYVDGMIKTLDELEKIKDETS